MNTLRDYLAEQLKNPIFKKMWNKGETTYQVTRKLIKDKIKSLSKR